MTLQSEEKSVTRVEEGRTLSKWSQSVVASDGGLLAQGLRKGLERLMEAERNAYVNASFTSERRASARNAAARGSGQRP